MTEVFSHAAGGNSNDNSIKFLCDVNLQTYDALRNGDRISPYIIRIFCLSAKNLSENKDSNLSNKIRWVTETICNELSGKGKRSDRRQLRSYLLSLKELGELLPPEAQLKLLADILPLLIVEFGLVVANIELYRADSPEALMAGSILQTIFEIICMCQLTNNSSEEDNQFSERLIMLYTSLNGISTDIASIDRELMLRLFKEQAGSWSRVVFEAAVNKLTQCVAHATMAADSKFTITLTALLAIDGSGMSMIISGYKTN